LISKDIWSQNQFDQALTCYFGYYKNPKNLNKIMNNSQPIFYYLCKWFSTKIKRIKNKNKFTSVVEIIIKGIISLIKVTNNTIILLHFRGD
jgi:hypothetical protein